MDTDDLYLGIDVGSISVNLVVTDAPGNVVEERYIRHHGQPMAVAAKAIQAAMDKYDCERIAGLATTGNGGRVVARVLGANFVNEVVAQAAATRRIFPEVRTVIEIGGEDSKLIFIQDSDEEEGSGEVADFAMNAACAAGTGSFLDQQASRLGLEIEELAQLALKSAHPARMAGRCSVFAKTDMIHLQQKATPMEDIVAGLCFALARNFKSTVGSGADIIPPISFHGGLAANPGMVRAMKEVFQADGDQFIIPEHFAAMGAIGAVLKSRQMGMMHSFDPTKLAELSRHQPKTGDGKNLEPLRLEKSVIEHSQLVEPHAEPGQKIPAYLGVDVGSISTCLAVIDEQANVLAKEYLMTAGRPLDAVQEGLRRISGKVGDIIAVRGVGTTGSGRYFIGDVIGADVVTNEITAHAWGARQVDPEVDTIFEIGGQDSKFTSLQGGAVVDFAMNNVCAAGTGSFLEEQAERLGISIKGEFADLAFQSTSPADLGERCTVFMETQVTRHQQSGVAIKDICAGLAYSIVFNYLNRVVEHGRIGNRIFFQGGTALNRAVVAAFENVTGKSITVPPDNEVIGAIGCALIAMDRATDEPSKFEGFDFSERSYTMESFICDDCPNHCEINKVTVAGEEPLYYGSRCGKYDIKRKSKSKFKGPDLFKEREKMLLHSYQPTKPLPADAPRVGIPRALEFHELFPLWYGFLTELGYEVVLSSPTDAEIIHRGVQNSVVETCFPMKLMLGHTLDVIDKGVDYVFLPSVINLRKKDPGMTDAFLCPYSQSVPYTLNTAIDFDAHGVKVLKPVVYLSLGRKHMINALKEVGAEVGKSKRDVARAVDIGLEALERFEEGCKDHGQQVLSQLSPERFGIVLVSRSYNGCDLGANLELPRKLAELGVLAIPMDFLPLSDVRLRGDWFNMFWGYGQKILSAAEIIAKDDRLHAIYLTNFGCGPDSFLINFFKEQLGTEPSLTIEIDEHSADAGMITRCEAFLDSLRSIVGRKFEGGRDFRVLTIEAETKRTILLPNMSPHTYLVAAAIQSCGINAEVLPEPDEETLYWGRKYTSGKECFPCIVTTGDMVKYLKREDFDRDKTAFLIGGSGGPCRFGQYNTLQRMVLDDIGYPDIPIYAPNQAQDFFKELGILGKDLMRRAWQGMIAVDVLQKALLETRPYETKSGAAEVAFQRGVERLAEAIRNGRRIIGVLAQSVADFRQVPVDRLVPRPRIGLVGEFYIRANPYSNQNVIKKIEALGGEVWVSPVNEWFLYRNVRRGMRTWLDRRWKLWLKNIVMDRVMQYDERKLAAAFDGFLRNAEEPSSLEVLSYASPYVHRSFEGEAIMTVGKAVDFMQKGLNGVVAVMPFTCMPGTIAQAILKRVRRDFNNIPFLNMVYDGDEQVTSQTRLEAFMYQAQEFAQSSEEARGVTQT